MRLFKIAGLQSITGTNKGEFGLFNQWVYIEELVLE